MDNPVETAVCERPHAWPPWWPQTTAELAPPFEALAFLYIRGKLLNPVIVAIDVQAHGEHSALFLAFAPSWTRVLVSSQECLNTGLLREIATSTVSEHVGL